jgi:hypothetical protein
VGRTNNAHCIYAHASTTQIHNHLRTAVGMVYMSVCVHAHMHTCTHAHMHTCTHARAQYMRISGIKEFEALDKESMGLERFQFCKVCLVLYSLHKTNMYDKYI